MTRDDHIEPVLAALRELRRLDAIRRLLRPDSPERSLVDERMDETCRYIMSLPDRLRLTPPH